MKRFALCLVAACLAASSCEPLPPHPPETVVELQQWQRGTDGQAFTKHAIVLHCLRRVLDEDLPSGKRVESLRVIEALDPPGEEACPALAQALANPKVDPALRSKVVAFLAKKGHAGLGPYVADALRRTTDPEQLQAMLPFAVDNPSEELLVEVVKLWASKEALKPKEEQTYRQIVERSSGMAWQDALLDALDKPEFFARGSAIEVLAARLPPPELRQRILAVRPRTVAVLSMQEFARRFEFVPTTRRELLATVALVRRKQRYMTPASHLAAQWRAQHRYRFNVRDFHLLSALASDPLRDTSLSRAQLVRTVSQAIARRRATSRGTARSGSKIVFRRRRLVDFDGQVESLSTVDLWNLLLLEEMLSRWRVRRMLQVTAQRDRADRTTQWGGLLFYESGHAEATLYWAGAKQGDDQYVPSKRMMLDAVDALGYFVGHFSNPSEDPRLAGPTDEEMAFAKASNLYGLVLTSVAPDRLNAAYFSPAGIVVDLGDYRTGSP